jgi:Ca2+-binding RTX toxin-like protein
VDLGSLTSLGTGLVLDTVTSGTVTFTSGSGAPASIETFTRVLRPGTADELSFDYEIVVSPEPAGTEPAIFAGTDGTDAIHMDGPGTVDDAQRTRGFGGDGRDTITWNGSGDASAEGGSDDDRLINRGDGTLDAFGGDGDDVIRNEGTADGGIWGYGGAGNDTLIGGESFRNDLFGGAGDDRLRAGDEGAWLDGGAGNDRLSGGAGEDWFAFDASGGEGLGRDRVKGFDEDADTLYFVGVDRSEVEVRHANGNTIITTPDGGWISVADVTLTEDDLVFFDELVLGA